MDFEIVPAHELSLAEQANIFNRAFAGYLAGWTEMDAGALARFLCAQGADLCYSRFVRANGELAGFGYINRTGNISRLAGMGTVPEARRTGAAAHLLSQLLEESKTRKDTAMMLEVFEQNLPALSLYRRYGFEDLSQLFGWRRSAQVAVTQYQSNELKEISAIDPIQMRSTFEYPRIPWQISRQAMAKVPAARVFGKDEACIVVGDTVMQSIRVHGFFAAEQDWNALRNILATVIQQFPNREFFAPAIFPEQFGFEIFEPLGFAREPLNQLLMRRDLL
jgi:ribosomal protein S18 acetylase RimI-like enzyme